MNRLLFFYLMIFVGFSSCRILKTKVVTDVDYLAIKKVETKRKYWTFTDSFGTTFYIVNPVFDEFGFKGELTEIEIVDHEEGKRWFYEDRNKKQREYLHFYLNQKLTEDSIRITYEMIEKIEYHD